MSRTHPIARRPPTFRFRRHGRQSPRPTILPPPLSRGTRPPWPASSPRLPRRLRVWGSKSVSCRHPPHPPPLYKGRRICGWVGTRRHEKHCFRGCRALVRGSSERAIDIRNMLRHNMLRLATSPVRRAFRRSGRPYHHRGWECGKSKAVAGQSKCNRGNELRQHEATAMPPTVVVAESPPWVDRDAN